MSPLVEPVSAPAADPAAEAAAFLAAHPDIETVDAFVVDHNGVARGKRIPAHALAKVYGQGLFLPRSVHALDIWGRDVAEARLDLPPDLARRGFARTTFELTPAEVSGKRAALACYRTQQEVMPTFLAAFVRRTEPFTVVPGRELGDVRALLARLAPRPPR